MYASRLECLHSGMTFSDPLGSPRVWRCYEAGYFHYAERSPFDC